MREGENGQERDDWFPKEQTTGGEGKERRLRRREQRHRRRNGKQTRARWMPRSVSEVITFSVYYNRYVIILFYIILLHWAR